MSFKAYETANSLLSWASRRNPDCRETAWIDGLRGVAAFLVLVTHFSTQYSSHFFSAPFGATVQANVNADQGISYHLQGDRLWGLWRLPILRLVSAAPAHVTLFYVLSGFVLSWYPVSLLQNGDYEKLYRALGSSIIRRWFRLHLAGAVVTAFYLLYRIYADDPFKRGAIGLTWEFIVATDTWANPFDMSHITPFSSSHDFNSVMWTLPFEFSGSIFVFVSFVALGRLPYKRRLAAVVFTSFWAMMKLRWDYWLFGIGFALADYVRHNGGFKKISRESEQQQLWIITLVVGLLLMSWIGPAPWYDNPGYTWSASLPMPVGTRTKLGEGIIIWGFGSILVVTSACHLTAVREVFELGLIQYLGKISFMLYLIHSLVNKAIGLPLRTRLYQIFCTKVTIPWFDPPEIYQTSLLFSMAVVVLLWTICLPLSIGLAHVFEQHIDRPCHAFAAKVDQWLLSDPDEGPRSPYKAKLKDEEFSSFDKEMNGGLDRGR